MDLYSLHEIIAEISSTHQIVSIVATSGTTSTGAVDPIQPIGELCQQLDTWFHIDGAYGYAYKLVPEWAHLFAGDQLADSITWDPHKQLGVPIPNSVLFVKDWRDLGRMSLYSDYFNRREDVEPNPGLKSPPSTRSMSVLPLVTLLRGQGLRKLIDDLRVPLTAVSQLATYLKTQPDTELFHEPDTGIICFRMRPAGLADADEIEQLQKGLYGRIMSAGQRSISITKLDGKTVLRLVSVAPTTTFTDYRETIDDLRQHVKAMIE